VAGHQVVEIAAQRRKSALRRRNGRVDIGRCIVAQRRQQLSLSHRQIR
jgi:hypothetical protein